MLRPNNPTRRATHLSRAKYDRRAGGTNGVLTRGKGMVYTRGNRKVFFQ